MKLFALLAFVGLAAASSYSFQELESGVSGSPLKWQPGQEYVYSYSGRLLTGIPELSLHHFSGLGIKCEVSLIVKSRNLVQLQVRDAKYSRVNEQMQPTSGDQKGHNWRFLQLPSFQPVPAETQRLLEQPAYFEISELSGKVKSMRASQEEPEWSLNFKKALIALFQTGAVRPESTEAVKTVKSQQPGSPRHAIPLVWTTFEQSPDGECETKYEMEEIPKAMAQGAEGEKLVTLPEVCPSSNEGEETKLYQLTKVRNLDNCIRSSIYSFYKPGRFSCTGSGSGSCGSLWTRSSITRYVVCGSPDRFVIQSIVNEGEINHEIMLFKTEKMLTGSRQILKLVNKKSVSTSDAGEHLSGTVEHSSLMYKYSKKEQQELQKQSISDVDKNIIDFTGEERINKEEVIRKVKDIVKEIVSTDLFNPQGLPEKEVSYKVLNLAKVFRMFDRTMLQKVYEDLVREESGEKNQIVKNILVDTIVMSGTPESIKFFMHLVERRELPKSQMAAIFFNLPRYVITPTRYLLEELFELIKSEPVRSRDYVYSTAVLSFSNLLQKACLSHNRHSSYPTEIYGKFCHKESSIITEKWIPYLQSKLAQGSSYERKNLHIVALGLLSHDQILPVVLPIIEKDSSMELHEEGSNLHMARYLSVYALAKVGTHYPERVLPVVSAIFANKAEPTDIRIAAFNVLMGLKPDMALLQKIATLTWTEKDTEVLRVINTAYYTLAFERSMNDYKSDSSELIRRVRLIYPLIKKTGGAYPSSATIYTNDFLEKMKVGYEHVTNWIGSEDSVLPSYFYDKITFFLSEEYKFTPIELAIHLREVFPNLYDTLSGTQRQPIEEIKSKMTQEWRQTIEKLRIKIRDNKTPEGYFFLNIFEDSTLFTSFSKASGEEIKRIVKNPALLKEYLSGEKKFNYQRVFDLSPAEALIPSDLGLPVIMDMHMPTVVSFRGWINGEAPLSYMKYDMTFETIVDRRLIGWVGTLCPFTGEYIITGVDEHTTMNLPVDWRLKVDLREGKIESTIKMSSSMRNSNGPYNLVYYRVVPFTVHQKFLNLRPIFKSENFKTIKSTVQEQQKEISVGDYAGIDMKVIFKTETPYVGLRYVLEKLSNMHWNPLNYARFQNSGLLGLNHYGQPSVRKHEVRIVVNPESSSTKEIDFVMKFGYGTKEKEQQIKYHKLEVEPESEKVVKVVAKPIGEHQGQAKRQEKVKEMLERLNIDAEGRAATVLVTATLKGSRPRTYSYSATVGSGQQGLKTKWDLKLKSETSENAICVFGDVKIPIYSIWRLNEIRSEDPVFHYRNTVGWGRECQSKIVINGYAKTSQEQKRLSQETPEAKELNRLIQKRTPMIKMSKLAETVRRQASALNEYNYRIDYVNTPESVGAFGKQALELLQVYWLPYYRPESSLSSEEVMPVLTEQIDRESLAGLAESSYSLNVRTIVHPQRQSFDVKITSSSGRIGYLYKDVPVPYPFKYMWYPVSYVNNPINSAVKSLIGKPQYPVCTLEGKHISTFDNRTYKADMDDCYHLLSGDCSKAMQYGVLVRALESQPEKKEIKILLKETSITLKPEGRRVIVKVNEREIEVPKTEKKPIRTPQGENIAWVERTKDEVVIVKSSKINILFDGKRVKLEGSNLLKNKLCGLCGDNNNKKTYDLLSPKKCVLSKPELSVASYRVGSLPTKQCRPLPEEIKVQLEKEENEQCVKPSHRHTKVGNSYSVHASYYGGSGSSQECMSHHHEIVDKFARNEYCFSRIPVLECGYQCHPVGSREKTVTFTCMPKDRRSEHIAEKVKNGEVLPELKNLPVSYSTKRTIPVECKPYPHY